jgi:hypothetical protein
MTWSNVTAGSYTLTARATDNQGNTASSTPVNITVTSSGNSPPSVVVVAPTNNATFLAPANISIQATASDSDGTVALVEFFNGSNKLGQDSASPYTMTWSNVAAGSYTLTARATDNQGNTASSAPITLTVQTNSSSGGPVYFFREAESATLVSPMRIATDANASGGQYIVTTSYGAGSATFNLNLSAAGTYFVWCRVLSVDWQNSFLSPWMVQLMFMTLRLIPTGNGLFSMAEAGLALPPARKR